MAFVIKFREMPSGIDIAKAVCDAVIAEGAAVRKADYPERREVSRIVDVAGVMNYGGMQYEILIGRESFRKAGCDAKVAFDALESDEINGIIVFSKKQFLPGESRIEHDINWHPAKECIEFLARAGERINRALSGIEAMAITYVPSPAQKRVYERIV